VTAAQVRDMLGLSDRGATRRLYGLLLGGDAPGALAAFGEQRDLGVDPAAVLRGLLEVTHGTTLIKAGAPTDLAQSAEERAALEEWAGGLSFALLHRLWQLLLKGHDEVQRASDPHQAADMALLRIIHASQLPDPGDLARKLESGAALAPTLGAAPQSNASGVNAFLPVPDDFAALILLLEKNGKPLMAQQLHDYAGLIRYAPPELALRASKPLPSDFARDLGAVLKSLTGNNWAVTLADEPAAPSLHDQAAAREVAARDAILDQPAVRAALDAFPEAELLDYILEDERSLTA
jgi:DNA polymerase III subunit gamma/tau